MIIGYSETFPWGGATDFVGKIISGEKIHTIREDRHRRWKPGYSIQMVTGNRTAQMKKFGEATCFGVQDIRILFDKKARIKDITVEGKSVKDIDALIRNDGLTAEDFRAWFYPGPGRREFSGRIIHWTNLLY